MAEGEEDQISAQNFYPRTAQVRKRKRSPGAGVGSKPVPPRHRPDGLVLQDTVFAE